MHGRVPREGEGSCRSLQSIISWHMQPSVIAADSNSFVKDGRKISVGDCALFKPAQDSPPFIGLIRWLRSSKDNKLKVGVNWLYRPAELNLGKGSLVDGVPNEIFYSFHKDEISVASLLHPCKVAFLPRGTDLPRGTSSFVCRRVYDIENKCLWWLTDQDYVNEHQEEVDQLLYKTRIEMHGTLQPGGRSPKQINGLTSASQSKSGSENVQNSGGYPSQGKGKKRERGDHSADPVKRERSSRTDDGGALHKAEGIVKSDISRITEKGGLVDFEGVEKLVQLMKSDRVEKKIDLIGRSMLTGVVASTEKAECLNRFVQLQGLPVFDEWLQDIHKGKVSGGNSSKDSDKYVEEFLLILLRALDKLPINLHALQTCNIGRSVNNLRSHKNVDIQRKARSLVDTWKKRVEAEMISNDAKSGSIQNASVWSSKSRLPEASHSGSRTPSGSDVAVKSSITHHSGSKTTSVKSSHGESNTKSASSSPGPAKPVSPPASAKDSQAGISVGDTTDVPQIREDRSSSSNQSHSYSQSISGKEDAKSPASVSATASKLSGTSSRNHKVSGFPGVTVAQKENSSNRSISTHKSTTSDKLSQSALMSERVLEGSTTEASNHKLIVKIPKRVRSPAQGFCGVSVEDPSIMSSQTSPPVPAEKDDQIDSSSKEKSDSHQCNVTSDMNVDHCQTNDRKDILSGSVDGAGLPAVFPDEEKSMSTKDSRRFMESPKKNQVKCGKLHESSFSPMNALIESCVKYSEAHSSLSLEDDVGMNLLASVATGEMSRSELVSPTNSTERSIPPTDDACFVGDEAKSKSSHEDHIHGGENQMSNDTEGNDNKQAVLNGSWSEDGMHLSKKVTLSSDINGGQSHTSADIPAGGSSKPSDSDSTDFRSNTNPMHEVIERSNQMTDTDEKITDCETKKENQEDKVPSNNAGVSNTLTCSSGTNAMTDDDKASKNLSDMNDGKLMVDIASSSQSCNVGCESEVKEGLDTGNNSLQKFTAVVKSEFAERANNENLKQTEPGPRSMSEAGDKVKFKERDEEDTKGQTSKVEGDNIDRVGVRNTALEGHSIAGSCSSTDGLKSRILNSEMEKRETADNVILSDRGFSVLAHEKNKKPMRTKSGGIKVDGAESISTVVQLSSSPAAVSDSNAKVKFDLNEGFNVDDGKYGEPVSLLASGSTTAQVTNSLQFSVNSIPTPHPPSITVAAAAKGPFLPPEDLLRSKGELGWKGSAATSAFRPAEPRKVIEMPLASTHSPDDASTCKTDRSMLDIDLNIDLNVPDERVVDEMASRDFALSGGGQTIDLVKNHAILPNEIKCSMPVLGPGGLDFDLNRVDEPNDYGQCSTSRSPNGENYMVHVRPLGGLPSTDVQRGFDLNDRPGVDDASVENSAINQQVKVGVPSHLPFAGPRTNNPGVGSFSSWFTPGNSYSTVGIPSVIPDRADQPFPIIPPGAPQRSFPAGITPFTPDVYRGSVLSSSPAVSFPPSPFQFPVFPFGPTFPLPSATFPVGGTSYADSSSGARLFAPPLNSQFLGPVGAISSQFQRPYAVGLPDSSSNGGLENSRKWGRQGLDLNAGPGATEIEVREDILPLSSGQHLIASSQVQSEEQARMYPASGSILKRSEPEGGWDKESFRYKQSSWH